MAFRPDGKFAYVVNELDSTVTAFAYDADAGALQELQTLRTVPEYFDGPNEAAWIGVHPTGKNLLVSNCGHHSVVLFTIDESAGTLTYVEDQSTYGTMPRHFGMAADGKHVVVANQQSGSILILRAPKTRTSNPAATSCSPHPPPAPSSSRTRRRLPTRRRARFSGRVRLSPSLGPSTTLPFRNIPPRTCGVA